MSSLALGPASRALRFLALLPPAAAAAGGAALVARPALLCTRSLGVLRTVLPWQVPWGGASLALAAALAASTACVAVRAALGRRPSVALHGAVLLSFALSLGLRCAAGEPRPPPDPLPALLGGLRGAAESLDAGYHGEYAPTERLSATLSSLPAPGFVRRGTRLPLRARILERAAGPQLLPVPGDEPGCIYAAVSTDRRTVWLTALSLDGIARLPSGAPALIEARSGTHSLPGRDARVPAYPGMRPVTEVKP
jgi:hypothetical protein